jgi:hypothetical protein
LAPRDHLTILNNVIILRAAMGEDVSAQIADLERSSSEMSGTVFRAFVADPIANEALAKGDLERARQSFTALYTADPSQTPEYAYRAGLVSIWSADTAKARELEGVFGRTGGFGAIVTARRGTLGAGLAALDGRTGEALPLFREALRNWRAAGAVWDEALTGITMAQLLDPAEPEVAEVIRSTREILERLHARPYLERLDAAAGARARPAAAHKTAATAATVVAN